MRVVMRILIAVLAAIFLVPSYAAARDAASLGDLMVSTSRVPDWYRVPEPDTSGWTEIDVTSQSEVNSVYQPDGTCNAVIAGTSGGNARKASIACMLDNNPGGGVTLLFPAGTYGDFHEGLIANFTTNDIQIMGVGDTTIVEVSGLPSPALGTQKGRCQRPYFGAHGDLPTTTETWITGFTRNTTEIGVVDASVFSVDDWVVLHHDGTANAGLLAGTNLDGTAVECPGGCAPSDHAHYELEEVALVTNVNADTDIITIDRGLRLDYSTWGTNPSVQKFVPRERVGVANLRFKQNSPFVAGPNSGVICMTHTVNSWVKDVKFGPTFHIAILLEARAARNYIAHNQVWDVVCDTSCASSQHYQLSMGAMDNLVHDNICGNASEATEGDLRSTCVMIYLGAKANMVTYNYSSDCSLNTPLGTGKRHIFFHGNFPYENLLEGNVGGTGCRDDIDTRYNHQGPRNTFFRGRSMDHSELTTKAFGLRAHKDDADRLIAIDPNFILNFMSSWYTAAVSCGTGEIAAGSCYPHDYGSSMTHPANWANSTDTAGNAVYEYNIGTDTRSHLDCTSFETPYECCNDVDEAKSPDGCTFGFALHPGAFSLVDNNNLDRNSATAAANGPWSGAGHDLPYSLVNLDADGTSGGWNGANLRPPGWCNEISAWPAVGADVDVMPTSNTIKIPAQRRYDGDACTAWTGGATPTLSGISTSVSRN